MYTLKRFTFLLLTLVFSHNAFADKVKAGFVELNLPPLWSCQKEEIDWVCQPDNVTQKSEIIMIIVNKTKDPTDDTMAKYLEYLKAPRQMRDLAGNPYDSQVKYTRETTIGGQPWADSLHLGSEIQGFYSRYLATFKDNVAGLVSYSIAESVYTKYSAAMEQMIQSMEITFDQETYEDLLEEGPTSLLGQRTKVAGRFSRPQGEDKKGLVSEKVSDNPFDNETLFQLLVVIAIFSGILIFLKRRKR